MHRVAGNDRACMYVCMYRCQQSQTLFSIWCETKTKGYWLAEAAHIRPTLHFE